MQKLQKRSWLILPAILIGIFIFFLLVKNKSEPEIIQVEEKSHAVRIIEVPRLTVMPMYHGHGNVAPSKVWKGVAQVSGKIIEINPDLKNGAMIPVGTVLLKIDPSDYELAVNQAQTTIEATKAQLADIAVREKNSLASIKIEESALKIGQAELERKRRLRSDGSVTASDFEREQRSVLAQQQSVQNLRNAINLYPVEKQRLNAEVRHLQSQLAGAKLNLERTTLVMPFNGRVVQSNTEILQFARQGDVLVTVDGIEKAEIEVQVPMGRMAGLLHGVPKIDINSIGSQKIGELLGLTAEVSLNRDGLDVSWPAKVVRISEGMDPRTRTIGVIVEVLNPYLNTQPGIRPPLSKGLFVDVKISGKPRPGKLVVPGDALHEDKVYLVNSENRMEFRKVSAGIKNSDYTVIESGLIPGDKIVISQLIPAIKGMLLLPMIDEEALALLKQAANPLDKRSPL